MHYIQGWPIRPCCKLHIGILHMMREFGTFISNAGFKDSMTDALSQTMRAFDTWLVLIACQCTYHAEEWAFVIFPQHA